MKKILFPSTIKVTQSDLNSLHDEVQSALQILQNALAGENTDPDKILFKNAPPLIDTPIAGTVRVPEQAIGINGVLIVVPQTDVVITPGSDRDIALFLRITKTDVDENRDYLDTSGTSPAWGNDSFTVALDDAVEVVAVDNYTGPGDDPAAVTGEVGIINYALITEASTVLSLADYDPDDCLWVFPVGTAVTAHASSHLTAGSDSIQLASPAQEGLISADDMVTVREAVTDVTSATNFLLASVSGDNVSTPKEVELALNVNPDSFIAIDLGDAVEFELGLNFLTNPLAGSSDQPARADHKHDLTAGPLLALYHNYTVTSPALMLTEYALTLPTTVGQVMAVMFYWLPASATNYPRFEANYQPGWLNGILVRAGIRYTMAAQRDMRIQFGAAMCELLPAQYARAVAAAGGTPDWQSLSGGTQFPTTGILRTHIIATASNVSLPVV